MNSLIDFFDKETVAIDSMNVMIPLNYCTNISFQNDILVSSDGEILKEISPILTHETDFGVNYSIKKTNLFGRDYLSFNLHSKMLGSSYLLGFKSWHDIKKLLERFQKFFSFQILFPQNEIDEIIINDVDICLSSYAEMDVYLRSFLNNLKFTTHSHAKLYRSQNTHLNIAKVTGFQLGKRSSYEAFLKVYDKNIEAQKHIKFYNLFGINTNFMRLELTFKKAQDVGSLFKSPEFSKFKLIELVLKRLSVHRLGEKIQRVDFVRIVKPLSLNMTIILQFFISKMNEGSSFYDVFSTFPIDDFSEVSKSRKRNEIRELVLGYYEHTETPLKHLKKDFWTI